MHPITIVYIYRNRDLLRVKRSLDSLTKQSSQAFNAIFIDYGSDDPLRSEVQKLIASYPFCKYFFNDTRGMPWNRSHALNTGIQLAETDFVFTADIDMIFKNNFVEILLAQKKENSVTFFAVNYLPENFSDWNNSEIKIYEQSKNFALGLALLPMKILKELHGYDEFYCFWGQEDNDMQHRLENSGVQTTFYETEILMHHQWHPSSTASEKELPEGWRVFQNDYYVSNKEIKIRNENRQWGKLLDQNSRPSLIILNDASTSFTEFNGSVSFFMYELNKQFSSLSSGASLAFEFTDSNSAAHFNSRLGKTISLLQKIFDTLKISVKIISRFRHLYTTVNEVRDQLMVFILAHRNAIKDYSLIIDENKLKLILILN